MKNLTLIFTFLFIGWSVSASVNSNITTTSYTNYNDSFIFIEGGVEFAVFPNGEFDFYYNPDFRRSNFGNFSSPSRNISYNSGYNYEPYIQYDDYGAVIQIENVPIYYDYYGRIIQAGDIYMRYNNFGRLARVGNLHVHYNRHHHITHYSGYINPYNRRYVYRPWHDYYRRPNANMSIVYGRPYRAYYEPQRIAYTKYVTVYQNNYLNNQRKRNFYRPSQKVRSYSYGTRTTKKRNIAQVRTSNTENFASSRQNASERNSIGIRTERNLSRGSEDINQSRNYSERIERSTTSRGRSAVIENSTQPRDISRIERPVRTPQRSAEVESRSSSRVERSIPTSREEVLQTRSNTRIENSAPATRSRTIERNSGNSARNINVERPTTRQSSSSVKTRSTSGTSRSQTIRSNNSSRSRSSARNVDNRL